MTEADIERYLVVECDKRQALCLKLALIGRRGFPDRTIITSDGRVIFVELKTTAGALSVRQRFWRALLGKYGFQVHVLRTKPEVDVFMSECVV
jgi:hypothetical protein